MLMFIQDLFPPCKCLHVFASGLGQRDFLLGLLQLHCTPHNLLFLIGLTKQDYVQFQQHLMPFDNGAFDDAIDYFHFLDSSTTQSKRSQFYKKGGVIMVSVQILLLDVLNGNIDTHLISDVVLVNAHLWAASFAFH